jgi:hypothetical protein
MLDEILQENGSLRGAGSDGAEQGRFGRHGVRQAPQPRRDIPEGIRRAFDFQPESSCASELNPEFNSSKMP